MDMMIVMGMDMMMVMDMGMMVMMPTYASATRE